MCSLADTQKHTRTHTSWPSEVCWNDGAFRDHMEEAGMDPDDPHDVMAFRGVTLLQRRGTSEGHDVVGVIQVHTGLHRVVAERAVASAPSANHACASSPLPAPGARALLVARAL